MFISFEGMEGSGKTTQAKLLKDRLIKLGYDVILTKNPGGDPISDEIRSILVNPKNSNLHDISECLLFFAARAQHYFKVIKPALKENKIVICDRFNDSTFVYQCLVKKSITEDLFDILKLYSCENIEPDLTFVIDIDAKLGLERAKKVLENKKNEGRNELNETFDFHKNIRNGFLDLYSKAKIQNKDNIILIDGENSISEIHNRIWNGIHMTLGDQNGRRSY